MTYTDSNLPLSKAGTSTRGRGWVMRGDTPTEIEYEHGFSLTDGFPYCHEIGTWIPCNPFPASTKESLINARIHELQNMIAEHKTAIQVLTDKIAMLERDLRDTAYLK